MKARLTPDEAERLGNLILAYGSARARQLLTPTDLSPEARRSAQRAADLEADEALQAVLKTIYRPVEVEPPDGLPEVRCARCWRVVGEDEGASDSEGVCPECDYDHLHICDSCWSHFHGEVGKS